MLGQLLHPYPVDEFYAEIWESRFLHISREENPLLEALIDSLLTLDDIDRLLTVTYVAGPRRADSLRMGQGGIMISPEMFLSNVNGVMAEVDVDRVLDLHRAGASIILNGVHTALESVGELCRTLSTEMGIHVHANIYVTPRDAQGFPVHFDAHDVFLLQVAGEKSWRLAQSPVPLATSEAQTGDQLLSEGPKTTVLLRRGELLYIPRGMLHEGVTSTELSAHLTVGMNPLTWTQLLHELVAQQEILDVDFRRSVRTSTSANGTSAAERMILATLAQRLVEDDALVARTVERLVRQNAANGGQGRRGQLLSMHDAEAVTLDTIVRRRPNLATQLESGRDEVRLDFGTGVLTLPGFTEPQVAALCSGRPVRGRELPPGLDDASRLVLIRRLIREGLLVTAADQTA